MLRSEAKKTYEELFDSNESKAKAFDLIAEKYYYSNFGTMSKSDFDVLMFSLYIDEILKKNHDDFLSYSDYTLSKQLGITQSRVSNLKVKKELLYPSKYFNWRKGFLSLWENMVYENGKIKLFIPDKNLFIEIKNAIECIGGFVEISLTTNLLQIRLAYFLDLLVMAEEDNSRDDLRKQIREKIREQDQDVEFVEKEPLGKALIKKTPDMIIDIISACIPVLGPALKTAAKTVIDTIKDDN